MSDALSPLAFLERALHLRGGLSERNGDRLDVVLPPELAASLGLAESLSLGVESGDSTVSFAGFGSAILERLVGEERAAVCVAAGTVTLADADQGGRPTPALASAYTLINGILQAVAGGSGRARVVLFGFAWKAECDDVREGLRLVTVTEPGEASIAGYEALLEGETIAVAPGATMAAALLEQSAGRAGGQARVALRGELADFLAAVVRRKLRDRERLRGYYTEARAELKSRAGRADAASVGGKLARLEADEAAKTAELDERYRVRLDLRLSLALILDVPVQAATLKLRRRKGERTLAVNWHPAVRAWEALVCDGCDDGTRVFGVCDEKLHVLCRKCYGSDVRVGRADCPRCHRRGSGRTSATPVVERLSAGVPATPLVSPPARPRAEPQPQPRVPRPPQPMPPAPSAPSAPPEPSGSDEARGQLALPFVNPADQVRIALAEGRALPAVEIAMRTGLAAEVVRVTLRREVARGSFVVEGRGRGTRYRLAASP